MHKNIESHGFISRGGIPLKTGIATQCQTYIPTRRRCHKPVSSILSPPHGDSQTITNTYRPQRSRRHHTRSEYWDPQSLPPPLLGEVTIQAQSAHIARGDHIGTTPGLNTGIRNPHHHHSWVRSQSITIYGISPN